MMTVYTGINVPYASMLGVMTSDSQEKTVFSSYRMFFAYGGSFIALFAWEPLCKFFVNYQPLWTVNTQADDTAGESRLREDLRLGHTEPLIPRISHLVPRTSYLAPRTSYLVPRNNFFHYQR